MKKDAGKIVMTGYLVILLLCPILYWIILQPRIPYDWWYYSEVYYPRQIADRLADCLFGIHLFLFGYLFFEKKHYAARVENQGREKIRRWMGLAILCQLGAFGVYIILWLAYTRTRYIPVDIPVHYLDERYLEKEKFWHHILPERIMQDEWLFEDVRYNCLQIILSLVVLTPIILYLVVYLTHFLVRWRQYKKRECISIGWKRWNLAYIVCVGIVLFRKIKASCRCSNSFYTIVYAETWYCFTAAGVFSIRNQCYYYSGSNDIVSARISFSCYAQMVSI